jgi:hypothetical protein
MMQPFMVRASMRGSRPTSGISSVRVVNGYPYDHTRPADGLCH